MGVYTQQVQMHGCHIAGACNITGEQHQFLYIFAQNA
jgi:hypothetical protein